ASTSRCATMPAPTTTSRRCFVVAFIVSSDVSKLRGFCFVGESMALPAVRDSGRRLFRWRVTLAEPVDEPADQARAATTTRRGPRVTGESVDAAGPAIPGEHEIGLRDAVAAAHSGGARHCRG